MSHSNPKCKKCGRPDTTKAGTDVRTGGVRVQKWRCIDCGHVFVEGSAGGIK